MVLFFFSSLTEKERGDDIMFGAQSTSNESLSKVNPYWYIIIYIYINANYSSII